MGNTGDHGNAPSCADQNRCVIADSMPRELASIRTPADLIGALRNRAGELELTHLGLDALAGLAEGHTGKLFCGTKDFGRVSLPAMLDALGVRLVLQEDAAATEAAKLARQRLGIGKRNGKYAAKVTAPARAMATFEAWAMLQSAAPGTVKAKAALVEAVVLA